MEDNERTLRIANIIGMIFISLMFALSLALALLKEKPQLALDMIVISFAALLVSGLIIETKLEQRSTK